MGFIEYLADNVAENVSRIQKGDLLTIRLTAIIYPNDIVAIANSCDISSLVIKLGLDVDINNEIVVGSITRISKVP